MILNFNPTNIIDAVYDTLNSDSTLRGSSYLNGTKKIFKRRAYHYENTRYIVITLDQWIPDSMNNYSGELRIYVYTKILANGQIDEAGDLVLNRSEELLNDQILTLSGGAIRPLMTLGIIPSYFDPISDNSKARGVLRMRVEAGMDG